MERVKCPYCGYSMPVWYSPHQAAARGVFVRCKGKQCRREFEIRIQPAAEKHKSMSK